MGERLEGAPEEISHDDFTQTMLAIGEALLEAVQRGELTESEAYVISGEIGMGLAMWEKHPPETS